MMKCNCGSTNVIETYGACFRCLETKGVLTEIKSRALSDMVIGLSPFRTLARQYFQCDPALKIGYELHEEIEKMLRSSGAWTEIPDEIDELDLDSVCSHEPALLVLGDRHIASYIAAPESDGIFSLDELDLDFVCSHDSALRIQDGRRFVRCKAQSHPPGSAADVIRNIMTDSSPDKLVVVTAERVWRTYLFHDMPPHMKLRVRWSGQVAFKWEAEAFAQAEGPECLVTTADCLAKSSVNLGAVDTVVFIGVSDEDAIERCLARMQVTGSVHYVCQ